MTKEARKIAARSIILEELEDLFDTNYFRTTNLVGFQRSVWWFLTQHFGHRVKDERRQLKNRDEKNRKNRKCIFNQKINSYRKKQQNSNWRKALVA